MCGICGMVGAPDRRLVARMTAAMVHRGPDEDGFFFDERAGLGFRRLAIIDVAGGRQPLANEDDSIQVVFNGEIYNHRDIRPWLERRGHRMRTGSDGEILAHLYEEAGPSFVADLNGIFAFALWDGRRGRLLLARDHHGVKPLYYAERPGRLLFASEIKALLASGEVGRDLDPEAVAQYLVFQAVPPPRSILAGVRMLPPGSLLERDESGTKVRSFWTPKAQRRDLVSSVGEAVELVRSGLEAAVERQLMSERTLGLFLSGGVDSSALVAMASRHVPGSLKTFSVGFVGPDEQVLTEWPWARLVAERYGTDHHEYVLTESTFRERMPHVLESMDQPTSDGVNSYYVSLAAAEHVTVALSGTGGDELFLGYERDAALLARHRRARLFHPLPARYVDWVDRTLAVPREDGLWTPVRRLADAVRTYSRLDDELIGPSGIAIFDEAGRDRVLSGAFLRAAAPFRRPTDYLRADVPPDPAAPGDWLLRLEQRGYLSFVLLRDIDAMSMTHSLEVRVPFLDPTYGDALARIPWEWKLREGAGKWILKEALRDLVPGEILTRPKMGFGLPYNTWMRRSLAPFVRDTLAPDRVRRRGLLDEAETTRLVDRFYGGDESVWRRVWTLFVLEAWATQTLDHHHG